MKILVKTASGNTIIYLNVDPTDTIEDIKIKIQNEGIPSNIQRLYLPQNQSFSRKCDCQNEENELNNETTLSEYCLCKIFHQGLILKIYRGVPIFIRNFVGQTITLEVDLSETVKIVKEKIHQKENIPSSIYYLSYAGKKLEEDKTLFALNIRKESILHLKRIGNPIRIFVNMNNTVWTLEVESSESIDEIKAKIYSMVDNISINMDEYYLSYAGKRLEEIQSLKDYNIKTDSILYVKQILQSMQIFIKNLDCKTITIDVEPTETIAEIKGKIFEKNEIPVNVYYLSYGGKILEDTMTISGYNITRESNLHMIIRWPIANQPSSPSSNSESELSDATMW